MTYSDFGAELRRASGKVATILDGPLHPWVDGIPIRPSEHGTSTEEGQGVVFRSSVIDSDIPKHIFSNLLGQVDVDSEEIG